MRVSTMPQRRSRRAALTISGVDVFGNALGLELGDEAGAHLLPDVTFFGVNEVPGGEEAVGEGIAEDRGFSFFRCGGRWRDRRFPG